jgi:hypothetical protein
LLFDKRSVEFYSAPSGCDSGNTVVAENEILYLAGARRWRATRKALRNGADADVVAQCLLDDMDRGLRNSLIATLRRGETLLTLFRAACENPVALRAVVVNFQDRQLACIVKQAIKVCGPDDPLAVAHYAGNQIVDQVLERALLYAGQCDAYSTADSRDALSKVLANSLERYRPTLMEILETSMNGNRVPAPKRLRATRASVQVRVKSVIETSLLAPGMNQQDATRRH